MFLDRYGLHLLSIPRENVAVGDLYVHDGRRTSAPGSVTGFLQPPLQLPPVRAGEDMANVAGTMSDSVSLGIGFGLLESFLAALGTPGLLTMARAGFESGGARTLRFRFAQATRDSLDAVELGGRMVPHRLMAGHALFSEDHSYYVVTAVARSRSISTVVHDEQSTSVSLGVDALKALEAKGGVVVSQSADGEVTFTGRKPLAFGVELFELTAETETGRLRLRLPPDAVKVRAGERVLVRPAFIGGDDGDVFLNLT
jgi:hypothetical protein